MKNFKWSIPKKKNNKDIHDVGDIIFVKKENSSWKLKQYPKANGGIVILDPLSGDVLALVGALILKQVNLIELHKQEDNLDLHLNRLCMLQLWRKALLQILLFWMHLS